MALALWAAFALLALLWTGGAWLAAAAAGWGAQALASGAAAEAGRAVASVPLPQWLALWLDPAGLQAVQALLLWAASALGGALPFVGQAAGWLVPLVWVVWALGLVVLLVLAAGGHWLLRRRRRSAQGGGWRR